MMGRRIFSSSGTPRKNMSFQIPCIAIAPPAKAYHVTLSCNSGVPAMPVGVQLEGARGLDYGEIIAGAGHELQADGKIFFGEAARDGEGREAAQIANGAQRVGEGQAGFQV